MFRALTRRLSCRTRSLGLPAIPTTTVRVLTRHTDSMCTPMGTEKCGFRLRPPRTPYMRPPTAGSSVEDRDRCGSRLNVPARGARNSTANEAAETAPRRLYGVEVSTRRFPIAGRCPRLLRSWRRPPEAKARAFASARLCARAMSWLLERDRSQGCGKSKDSTGSSASCGRTPIASMSTRLRAIDRLFAPE